MDLFCGFLLREDSFTAIIGIEPIRECPSSNVQDLLSLHRSLPYTNLIYMQFDPIALSRSCITLALLSLLTSFAPSARAQQFTSAADATGLPDAPQAAQAQATSSSSHPTTTQINSDAHYEGKQTKRILWIIPNFRAVSVDVKLPSMTVKEKFLGATQDSFDYSSFIYTGMLAGISMWSDSYPEFHQGAAGYGRYYWHTFVDQTDENYWTEFILPVAFHQDPRYYTLGRGGIFKRTAYSFSRALITRTDSGKETFNVSEVVGAGAAAGISNLYYPEQYRTWTKTGQRWASSVALDSVDWIFKEFWPDINAKVFHQKPETNAPAP